MRIPLLAANWKMNKTNEEAFSFINTFLPMIESAANRETLIIPPFPSLGLVKNELTDSAVALGAQNLHQEKSGAYTGETSAEMLLAVGCTYVLVGHSERRQFFGESNFSCNEKIHAAFKAGLTPIYCIGETLEQREQETTLPVVEIQIKDGLKGLDPETAANIVIAYEPVWAIGTGLTATTEQAQEVHAAIRDLLRNRFGKEAAEAIRIQYGGSVKPGNVDELMAMPDIDGALVGGAALDPDSFARIVMFE
jgi:triosephosphate isomerase (TIM)